MASLKKAIQAHCKNCTYDRLAPGTWREQVEACTVKSCALWEVRPLSSAGIIAVRVAKAASPDIDALIDGLEDDDEEVMA